jgi:hypothetical protein
LAGKSSTLLPPLLEEGEEEGDSPPARVSTLQATPIRGQGGDGDSLDSGSMLGESLRKKRIGGKVKLSYTDEKPKPTPKPYTDDDEVREAMDNPPAQTQAPLSSIRSPKMPKKRAPKIALDY